jgi:hypothetical protein
MKQKLIHSAERFFPVGANYRLGGNRTQETAGSFTPQKKKRQPCKLGM